MDRIVYLIVPPGPAEDIRNTFRNGDGSGVDGVNRVFVIEGADWNNDLTPWPAEGVFRKAKPFGGQASGYLQRLICEIIPRIESENGIICPERTIAGVSLSGLFALWAGLSCDFFTNVISISGSLWYDGFAGWVHDRVSGGEAAVSHQTVCPGLDSGAVDCKKGERVLQQVYLSLGDREKLSRDPRLATVEDATAAIAATLASAGICTSLNIEPGVTHFSPIIPRIMQALSVLSGLK